MGIYIKRKARIHKKIMIKLAFQKKVNRNKLVSFNMLYTNRVSRKL